jgi:hypothetical protein
MDFINEHLKLIISFGSMAIGLVIFLYSIYYFVKAGNTKYWRVTEGIILTSDVVKEKDNSEKHGYSWMYKAEICYSYAILKEKFVSNKICFLLNFSSSSSRLAYERTIKYPPGTSVEVYYNPVNPGEAILEPGVKDDHIVFLVLSGVVFLAASGFVIYFLFIEQSATTPL